jgi:outer membrane protein assembly factor BamB
MRHAILRGVTAAVLAAAVAGAATAENWPGWRGPRGDGHSGEAAAPLKWSATEGIRWKAKLPGPGMSSPIVWGQRVLLTQALDPEGKQRALLCFDRKDGRELWRQVVPYAEKESTYASEPHYCSASPVTDGERVVVSHGSAGLFCYDLNGKELWRRDFGKCEQIWGNAASPALHGDLVFLNFGPGERTFLVAVDKRTGKDVWKHDIPGGRYGTGQPDWIGSWSTPVIAKSGGKDALLLSWPEALVAYEPTTGRELWRCGGLGKLVYTSPLAGPDVIVAMGGFGGPAIAVRPGGEGDVTATHRLWQHPRSPQRIGSGVIVGDHIYILNATGVAECVELKTGRQVWSERLGGASWGSMVHVAGRLYVTNQQGETAVLAAKPVFEVLARNPLGERSQSSPAVSNGELFIRTYGHLWCVGGA